MKNLAVTLLTSLALLTSCTKDDNLSPVPPPPTVVDVVVPVEECLEVCGNVIYAKHYFNNTDSVSSHLTLKTLCDTVDIIRVHTIDDITYSISDYVCFDRNEL